jgi:glutaredoxin 3
MELYQAEWCPHSRNVRQRLTELGLDFVARQVPADEEDRDELERATGSREIPVLVTNRDEIVRGEQDILAYLGRRFTERADADRHREKLRAA